MSTQGENTLDFIVESLPLAKGHAPHPDTGQSCTGSTVCPMQLDKLPGSLSTPRKARPGLCATLGLQDQLLQCS